MLELIGADVGDLSRCEALFLVDVAKDALHQALIGDTRVPGRIADGDHEVVRRGLIDLLSADPELEVIGEAGSVTQALARIPALQPDVAVLDVRLPDGNGIAGIRMPEAVPAA